METIQQLIETRKLSRKKPGELELRSLPFLQAYIYGRVSSPGQVRDSRESILEIASLLELAISDGYITSLDPQEIKAKLEMIRDNPSSEKYWSDGQVTIDVRDLGISGQLSYQDRQGLADMQKGIIEGKIGAVYLTEGVSRLSRDKDRIIPYQLLKLLKDHSIRIRTLDGIWNPVIDRDNDYLADEFDDAIGERKVMGRRMFRRKAQKAGRGEYVGEPVPPGYFLPITGQKPTGQYEYGTMEPHQPHATVVNRILEEFVAQGGSYIKTLRKLEGITIPYFPSELKHMKRLSSMRNCKMVESGYVITASLIRGLATNVKLIGVWQWGDVEPIPANHAPVVSEELFLEAYRLSLTKGKAKGKAANSEPMEWTGLLTCMNHNESRKIRSIASKGRYLCDRGYLQTGEHICMDIAARYLDEPLTTTVLNQLDLTPFTEEILSRMESESTNDNLEKMHSKRESTRLEKETQQYQALLTSCVDEITGEVDQDKEEYYWAKIRELKRQLDEIKSRPAPAQTQPVDYSKVREFLWNLSDRWQAFTPTLRNRLLKLLIEKVEVRGRYEIEAIIYWKNGLQQKVLITRAPSNSTLEKRWTVEEDNILATVFLHDSEEDILAALPGRSWKGITLRAGKLNLRRARRTGRGKAWSRDDDERLKSGFEAGMTPTDIAKELGRSVTAVTARIRRMPELLSARPRKAMPVWEVENLIPSQQSSPRGGLRG
ncbi:MAG: recombinase family protein [Dehalococcoidales bacterium]